MGLRDLRLVDAEGNGVHIATEGQVEFSVLPYDDHDLINVEHDWELAPSKFNTAHFDFFQQGVGSGSCGPALTLDKYKVPTDKVVNYTLRFSGLGKLYTGISNRPFVQQPVLRVNSAPGAETATLSGALPLTAPAAVLRFGGARLFDLPLSAARHGGILHRRTPQRHLPRATRAQRRQAGSREVDQTLSSGGETA